MIGFALRCAGVLTLVLAPLAGAPGQAADIISVPGNPGDDIGALKEVNFVMKDGRIVKRP